LLLRIRGIQRYSSRYHRALRNPGISLIESARYALAEVGIHKTDEAGKTVAIKLYFPSGTP